MADTEDDVLRKRQFLYRAIYGEFMATILFLTPVFGVRATSFQNSWNPDFFHFVNAVVNSFSAIAMIFSFSSVSGAQFNTAISFSLWLTGKLSNRKLIAYWIVQFIGSVLAMFVVFCCFDTSPAMYSAMTPQPSETSNLWRVFASEFWCTFLLTFSCFQNAYEDAETQKAESMSVKTLHAGNY